MKQQVFVWGESDVFPGGALEDVTWPRRAECFEENPSGWQKLDFGQAFGVALDRRGQVFVWGAAGAPGKFLSPTQATLTGMRGKVVDVQCSSSALFVLTSRGEVLKVEGIREVLASQVRPSEASQEPQEAGELSLEKLSVPGSIALASATIPGLPAAGSSWFSKSNVVKQMSVGAEHAAFVTTQGELYCVGANTWGQCGKSPGKSNNMSPVGPNDERLPVIITVAHRVEFPDTAAAVASVAVGGRHTMATDETGRVYAFGDDRRIQLGLGDTRTGGTDTRHSYGVMHLDGGIPDAKAEMKRRTKYRFYESHMQAFPMETLEPTAYNRPPYPPPSFIVCGEDFTIAVTRDSPEWLPEAETTNVLMACGNNRSGQCGRSMHQSQQVWTPAKTPKLSLTEQVSCGSKHCLALTKGAVYTWGGNTKGQIGNGKTSMLLIPTKVSLQPPEGQLLPKEPTKHEDGSLQAVPRQVIPLPGKIVSVVGKFNVSAVICDVPDL